MLLSALLPLLPFFLAATVSAQEVENEDVPSQCRAICANTLAISSRCNSGDDDLELNCICSANNASSDIPNCEACVAEFDESDNNVRDIVSSCSFAVQATYTTAPGMSATNTMSTPAASTTPTSNPNAGNDNCDPDDDGDDDCVSSAGGAGVATSTTVNSSSAASVVTVTQTGGAAQPTQTSGNGGNVDEDGDDSAGEGGSSAGNGAVGVGVPALAVGGGIVLVAAALL